METSTFKISESFEAGAILYDNWGTEQTNIDFYVILERTGMFVKIARLKRNKSEEIGFMSYTVSPMHEIDTTEPIQRKKIKVFSGKESGFSLRNYSGGGWVNLWNGKDKTITTYA